MKKHSTKTMLLNNFRKVFMNGFCEKLFAGSIKKQNAVSHFISKLVPPNYLYPAKSHRRIKAGNIHLTVDISDYVGHYLYFGFKDVGYEKLFSLVKAGDVIMDVGANIGFTALSLSEIAGNSGAVYAFEPDPYNFNELKNNVSLNPGLKISISNTGLSDKKDKLKLAVYEEKNRGMNRVDQSASTNFTWIEVNTLDNFAAEKGITKIDLIKIDTEGFEYNVLSGCTAILASQRPVLFIELDDHNLKQQQRSAKALIELLTEAKYNCYNSMTNKAVTAEDDFTDIHVDIICRPV